jgi:mannose-6-phosphate isomerase
MGRGLDFCLDIFDYTGLSTDEIRAKYRLTPRRLDESGAGALYEELAGPPTAPFGVRRLSLDAGAETRIRGNTPRAAIATGGTVTVKTGGEMITLTKGQSIFVAAAAEVLAVEAPDKAELCFVQAAG